MWAWYSKPSSILSNCSGKNWIAAGDAASSYDSISSAGITKALAHGINAGKALVNYFVNDDPQALQDYQQKVFDDFNQYLRLHQQLYCSEKSYPDSDFWRRRAKVTAFR